MTGTGFNPINYIGFQNPAAAIKLQQQQLLAQKLMDKGDAPDEGINQLANPGGLVVPYSPWQGLAKAGEKISGAYLQNKNNEELAKALQGDTSQASSAALSQGASQGDVGPTNTNAQRVGQMLQGSQGGGVLSKAQTGTVTGSPQMDMAFLMNDPVEYMKQLATRNMPTDKMKEAESGNPLIRDPMVKAGLIEGGKDYLNLPSSMPNGVAQPSNMNPMLPNLINQESGGNSNAVSPKGAGGMTQIMPATAAQPGFGVQPLQGWDGKNPATAPVNEQVRFGNDYLNAQQNRYGGDPRLAAAAYNAGPGAVDKVIAGLPAETRAYVPKVAGYDRNSSADVKGAETEAVKYGETAAETVKNLDQMTSKLPLVLSRLDTMRTAAKDASFGYGVDNQGEGAKQDIHDQLGDKTAQANNTLMQLSAQGVLPELGPQLQGMKGNKFLESLAASSSGLNMKAPANAKVSLIDGLEKNYIGMIKSTAAQMRSQGQSAPSDAEIDAMVAKHAPQKAPSGVTHVWTPNGIQPVGGK